MLDTQEQRTEGMKRQAQDLIDQAYQRGFKDGRELTADRENELIEQGIEYGRNEAWEVAGRLVAMEYWKVNDILSDGVLDIKTDEDIFIRLTASEAIEKLKAWEQKQEQQEDDELHVGDEVIIDDGRKVIVLGRDCSGLYHLLRFTDLIYNRVCPSDIKKTGRTFPEIAQVLAKMKEE